MPLEPKDRVQASLGVLALGQRTRGLWAVPLWSWWDPRLGRDTNIRACFARTGGNSPPLVQQAGEGQREPSKADTWKSAKAAVSEELCRTGLDTHASHQARERCYYMCDL